MQTRRDVFQAIADPTRREILGLIARQPMNLNTIAENFDSSRPAISQHIKLLTECGLVTIRQQGRERYAQATLTPLSQVADWIEPFRQLWEEQFTALDNLLHKLQIQEKQKQQPKQKKQIMNKTTVKAEPGKQELFIIREFEAPRELVFKAFSDAKLLAQWLSPCGMTIHVEKLEPEGGPWRFTHSTPDGKTFGFHGVMHEVLAPERIIRTFEYEGLPEKGHVILETLRMEPLPNNRTRVTIQSVFQSVADRDGMVASGVENGTSEAHQLLDDLLAKLQPKTQAAH